MTLDVRRRLALVLEYDGGRFGGSQFQKNAPSIQEELQAALKELTGEALSIAFAGRTDAGVDAAGQVAAFSTDSTLEARVITRGLNALLPEEIAVVRAKDVPAAFNPRRDASSRTYRYTILNAHERSPLQRQRTWLIREPIDTRLMQEAASTLLGEHDFAAFSRPEGVSTIRCVRRCEVTRRGPLITIEMEANAFLRHQVRRTVGALVEVGIGRLTVATFGELLQRAVPGTAEPVAPAPSLCLLRVAYPGLDLNPLEPLS